MGSGWLKALEIRGATAFLGFIAAALVSAGHELRWASLSEMPGWAAAVANVLAILFLVLATPWLVRVLGHPIRAATARRGRREEIRRQIESLTMEEALVLWTTVAMQRRAVFAPGNVFAPEEVGAAGLFDRGLVEVQARVGGGIMFFVRDDVWEVVGDKTEVAQRAIEQLQHRR